MQKYDLLRLNGKNYGKNSARRTIFMNPFKERSKSLENNFLPLKKMYPKSYNKERPRPTPRRA